MTTKTSLSYQIQFSSLNDVAETLSYKIEALFIILTGLEDGSWNSEAIAGIQYFLYDLQHHVKLLEQQIHETKEEKTQQD